MFWYVWRCKPNQEIGRYENGECIRKGAREELQELGMQVVCPTIPEFKRFKKAGKRETERALFRGYVIAGSPIIKWMQLADLARNSNKALLGVVCIGNGPARISETIVQHLSGRTWQTGEKFKSGDEVRVKEGPFFGQVAKIESLDDERAVMLVSMLGQSVRVSVDIDVLEEV